MTVARKVRSDLWKVLPREVRAALVSEALRETETKKSTEK